MFHTSAARIVDVYDIKTSVTQPVLPGILSRSINAAKAVMDEQGTQEDAGPLAC